MRSVLSTTLLAPLFLVLGAPTVHAQTAYCRHVDAAARSRSYLLMSPSLTVQGLHVPGVGDETGAGLFQRTGWQLRAALSWSVLDVARGAWVLEAAAHECRRYEVRESVERVLGLGADYGRLPALRAELAYLEEQLPAIEALLRTAEERRERLLSTQHQLDTLRLRANAVDRRIVELRREIERLEIDAPPAGPPLREQLDAYESSSMALEREESSIRRIEAWRLNVRIGVVPTEPFDWFGVVELSYNLGGVAQWLSEDELLSARQQDLRESRYELRYRVERFERTVRASLDDQERALVLIEAQIELTERQRRMFAELAEQTGDMLHAQAMVELNRIELEAERRYRARLLAEHRGVAAPASEGTGEDAAEPEPGADG